MKSKVVVVDYGIGNILSVTRALDECGATTILSDIPDIIESADRVILPGVGAFAKGMAELEKRRLVEPIKRFCQLNRPFMGICLGMQMMLDETEEFGIHKGLSLLPGAVKHIPTFDDQNNPLKAPHIGWNEITFFNDNSWENSILSNIPLNTSMYFVHSYMSIPENPTNLLAVASYSGQQINAAIRKDNLYGFQFHPEKSGSKGLQIIKDFINL